MVIIDSRIFSNGYTPINNLAEVQLFYGGVQLSPASLSFTLSSAFAPASNCNNGILTDYCHSGSTDTNPTLTITGSGIVDTITVYNRADYGQERIVNGLISFAYSGVPYWTGGFTSTLASYTFNIQGTSSIIHILNYLLYIFLYKQSFL